MSKLVYSKALNKVTWGEHSYKAITGGFGKGPLPSGKYKVEVRHVVVNLSGSGFQDNLTKKSWFIPITPSFSTPRDGFGIHPDGSPKGTKGCIGLQGRDSERFWKKWNNTPLRERPASLTVK